MLSLAVLNLSGLTLSLYLLFKPGCRLLRFLAYSLTPRASGGGRCATKVADPVFTMTITSSVAGNLPMQFP